MLAQKLSISLSQGQYEFLESYQAEHRYKSRSEVVSEAIRLLQQLQLEAYYHEANQEIDQAFEIATADGIEENETW